MSAHEEDGSKLCDECGVSYDIHEYLSPRCRANMSSQVFTAAPDDLDPDVSTPDEILQREQEQEEAESDEKDRIVEEDTTD